MVKQTERITNRKGESYVDTAITVMIAAFVLVFAVSIVSLAALSQNVRTVSDLLTDSACLPGCTDIGGYAGELREKTGIDLSYSLDGTVYYDQTAGKVQLGDAISCTVTYSLTIPGFGDVIHPVTVTASSSGLSRYYWK